jgi:hypothetical protein
VYIPAYSPFVYVPYSPMYYPATPGCMAVSHGAGGSCAAGTCSGAVSAGACGAGSCGGGVTGGEFDDGTLRSCNGNFANGIYRLQRWSDTRWLWRLRWQWRWRRLRRRRWWRELTSGSCLFLSSSNLHQVYRKANTYFDIQSLATDHQCIASWSSDSVNKPYPRSPLYRYRHVYSGRTCG